MVDKCDMSNGSGHEIEHEQFDRELDKVLAKYTAADPRAGLEQRVLANLRVEQAQAQHRALWPWRLAAPMAIALVVLALVWRTVPSQPEARNGSATVEAPKTPDVRVASASNSASPPANQVAKTSSRCRQSLPTFPAALPKLDQFPSSQPLSEQEKMLASYVYLYPRDAALIAEARMESLRLDQEGALRETSPDSNKKLQ
jgi:hypothetical protein